MPSLNRVLPALMLVLIAVSTSAQEWVPVSENSISDLRQLKVIQPGKFALHQVDPDVLLNKLNQSPQEFTSVAAPGAGNIILLPHPDGSIQRFKVVASPVMEAGLASKYPEIKTWSAQGIDDPYANARMDFNPWFGFHAQVLTPSGNYYIDPYSKGNISYYMSYRDSDYSKSGLPFICETETAPGVQNRVVTSGPCRGTQLFTYRLALACTGEYATAVCAPNPPTLPVTLAAMVTSVNRVSGVYETELAVRLLLIANNDLLVYLDGTTDPYTNNNGVAMLTENQTNITTVIGSANFDIGHVFSTGGGGIAGLGVVCIDAFKARGVTGLNNPLGDGFDIDYVAHEMGHQFGGNHTFNSITGACGGGNRNGATAYEVGSGTTIMAYAGICGSDNIQPNSDPFFHTVSYDEISTFITSGAGTCHGTLATGNNIPVITAMNNNGVTIPELTPFVLTGTATDANGDALTYCWEEWDLGGSGAWNGGASTSDEPLFKSRVPKNTGVRMIPDINVILAGYPAAPAATMGGLKGETLADPNGPNTRELRFRLTVRDNRSGGGGVATGGGDLANPGCSFGIPFSIFVKGAIGPFAVITPNGGENWLGGSTQTITWDVASTDVAPINTSNVNILMSTDGGLTYPTTILSNTPNDGAQSITVPNIPTNNTVRFMVQASGNIFFDISDNNFTITFSTLPVELLDFVATPGIDKINLSWKTVFEENNRGFEIQRSTLNTDFAPIGFINSSGSGSVDRHYSFVDANVVKNTRYNYRLMQIDLDGRIAYSDIRSAVLKESLLDNITIYPNPVVQDVVSIRVNESHIDKLSIRLLDAAGRILKETEFNKIVPGIPLTVEMSNLPAGVYLLRVAAGEEIRSFKVMKY